MHQQDDTFSQHIKRVSRLKRDSMEYNSSMHFKATSCIDMININEDHRITLLPFDPTQQH